MERGGKAGYRHAPQDGVQGQEKGRLGIVPLHQEGGGGGGKPLVPRDVQGQPVQEGSLYSKGVHNLKGHVYIAPAFKGGLDANMAIPGQ